MVYRYLLDIDKSWVKRKGSRVKNPMDREELLASVVRIIWLLSIIGTESAARAILS